MAPSSPVGHQRSSLSGMVPPEAHALGGRSEIAPRGQEDPPPIVSDRPVPPSLTFVLFAGIELAFVFGLLVLTKLTPTQVLTIAAQATGISVAGFFGRNVIIVVGRLMNSGSGNR
jgi:hypothetical protein